MRCSLFNSTRNGLLIVAVICLIRIYSCIKADNIFRKTKAISVCFLTHHLTVGVEYYWTDEKAIGLKTKTDPGSSLGGARPKANVKDEKGNLWIAKFPSRNDRKNVGAWEALTMTLAKQCGIKVAPFKVTRLANRYSTFLTKRFDRIDGKRIHFTSAMTMLGYSDGETSGCSYLELFEWISRNCCDVKENLAEMWRRIVFNIAVSNCDDHLRNHGFLLTKNGWTLSPAYDLNPQEYGNGLSLNINENNNALDFQLAIDVAQYAGITLSEAQIFIKHTTDVVSGWRKWANLYHISRDEQEMMATAFKV